MNNITTSPPSVLPPDYTQLVSISTTPLTHPHLSLTYRDDTGLLPQGSPDSAYLYNLRCLNDDLYLTSYPSLPPRSHHLTPSSVLSNMPSFPYSPLNDLDLTRNLYTKHSDFEFSPSLTFRSTHVMPQGHEINALRHYQRQLLQQSDVKLSTHQIPIQLPTTQNSSNTQNSATSTPSTSDSLSLFSFAGSTLSNFLPIPSVIVAKEIATHLETQHNNISPPNLQNSHYNLDPQHRSAYDGISPHMFSPTVESPHLFSYSVSSNPTSGLNVSSTVLLKNKLLFHLLLKQNPKNTQNDLLSETGSGISSTSSRNSFSQTSPSADFVFMTKLTPLAQASVRLYDVGSDGVGQAALSLGMDVKNHNLNFTIQSRPPYLFLPHSTSSNSLALSPTNTIHPLGSNSGFGLNGFHPSSTPSSSTSPPNSINTSALPANPSFPSSQSNSSNHHHPSLLPSLSSPPANPLNRHPSDTLVDALAAGLLHENPQNTQSHIQSWKLSKDIDLTPLERMILDKPVVHFTATKNVNPLFTDSELTRAWFGVRVSASTYFPHWYFSQNPSSSSSSNPASLQPTTSLHNSSLSTTNSQSLSKSQKNANSTAIASISTPVDNSSNATPSSLQLNPKTPKQQQPTLLDSFYPSSPIVPTTSSHSSLPLSVQFTPAPAQIASLSNLLMSVGTTFVQKSPTSIFSFETTDTMSSLRASYTHIFDAQHTIHSQQNNNNNNNNSNSNEKSNNNTLPPAQSLKHALFSSLPKLTASVSVEMNLKQLRASQVALYEQFHYHNLKKQFEYQRQMAMDFLHSVGSGPKTPVVTPSHGTSGVNVSSKPQQPLPPQHPQQHNNQQSLPLPAIPLAQSHPYILSPTSIKALFYATTTQLSNTYYIQSSLAYNFSPQFQSSIQFSSHGDLALYSHFNSHPSPLMNKTTDLCPTCGHRRCHCFSGTDLFGVPVKFNLGLKTNFNSVSPIQDTNLSFSTTIGHM